MASYRDMGRRDGASGAPPAKCGLGPRATDEQAREYWDGYDEGRRADPFGVRKIG